MIEKFLTYIEHERHLSELTVITYRNDLRLFQQFIESRTDGKFEPQLVQADDIRAWILHLMQNKYGARNIARKISALRSFWRYALKMKLLTNNPTAKIITPKFKAKLPSTFRQQEVDDAIKFNDDTNDFEQVSNALIIDILYQTGMRQAELLNLTMARITLKQHGGEIKALGKRNKERIIPFGEELAERIRQYIIMREQICPSGEQTFLLQENGKPITKYYIYRAVHDNMALTSTQHKLSPHVLRHTFATTMLNNGADINAVKTLLGHANLNATQVYTHVTFEEKLKAYRKAHPRAGSNE